MALEMNDLMALKSMGNGGGMTPYEQYMVSHKESKKPSGVAIAGLTVASVAAVAGATAALLLAPEKGEDAREKISDAVKDFCDKHQIQETIKDFCSKHNISLSKKQAEELAEEVAEA